MQKSIKLFVPALMLILLPVFSGAAALNWEVEISDGTPGLSGKIFDSQSGRPLPARIVIKDKSGKIFGSYYNKYPGLFTHTDGTFDIDLQPGDYRISVFRGIDYLSQSQKLNITEGQRKSIKVKLEPWVLLRKLGWVNGEGHAHLYTEKKPDQAMLETVQKICTAQGVDFISSNQGWGGYTEDNWQEGYAQYSDDRFLLHYGAEMPKYRTGHTWWLNLKSCRSFYEKGMDVVYEEKYYQHPKATSWTFNEHPFPNIPDVEVIPRFQKADNAVACIPHPTSWWWQQRGDVVKYTSNVCEYLSFSLLSGGIWDGFVVMGYDRDHYFYQNLWFNILNQGYKMPAVAELDGGYGENNKFPYGSMRVYYQTGGNFDLDSVAGALRKGKTFVTSGPIVFVNVDEQYKIGDVIPADGKRRSLNIEAYASGDSDDYLSYIVVFRNGKIYKLWDVRKDRPRQLGLSLELEESESAWYVVKLYGRDAWKNPKNLDVMFVCEQIQQGSFKGEVRKENSNAMTSPIYFRKPGESQPPPLVSTVKLKLIHPDTGESIRKADIRLLLYGKEIRKIKLKDSKASFKMPVNAMLEIKAGDRPVIRRGLYLDYLPHQQLLEEFASGRWLEKKSWKKHLGPGQVPWQAFEFEKTKNVLEQVDWIIEVKENERDALWKPFESLFD